MGDISEIKQDIREIKTHLEYIAQSKQDQETRLRSVEKRIWVFSGIAAALGGSFEAIMKKIGLIG